jgi:hypothetical protein
MSDILIGVIVFGLVFGAAIFGMFLGRNLRVLEQKVNARENQGYRDQFLASIRDRLDTAAVKGQALDLCQELFVADGARSDEEDAVLQNLRKLLE